MARLEKETERNSQGAKAARLSRYTTKCVIHPQDLAPSKNFASGESGFATKLALSLRGEGDGGAEVRGAARHWITPTIGLAVQSPHLVVLPLVDSCGLQTNVSTGLFFVTTSH